MGVPAGTYAVRLTVNGIEWLKFIQVVGDTAIELATPEFVVLQDKPYIVANYVDMHMGTGVTSRMQGYVRIDEATRNVALGSGITRELNNGIYCARLYTPQHLSDTKVINMAKYSGKLGDIFGKAYNAKRLRMSDILNLMASGDASVTRVCKGDYGFEDLSNAYEGHMEFFIVKHMDGVCVIGTGFNYAEIVDVK